MSQRENAVNKELINKGGDFLTVNVLDAIYKCCDVKDFIKKYVDCFDETSLKEYLQSLLTKYDLKRSVVIKASQLGEPFANQLFAGIRSHPSRDKVIALAVAMKITFDECQRLLKIAGVNELYPKNRRDAIIIFGLAKKLSVMEVNEILYDLEEFTL